MKYIYRLITLSALLFGCAKEDATTDSSGYGSVDFQCNTISIVENTTQTRATVELPSEVIPEANLFSLNITGDYLDPVSGEAKRYEQDYSNMDAYDSPIVPKGDYIAGISYGDINLEGADRACFKGSASYEIIARKEIEQAITAKLVNSAIAVTFDEWFNKYYANAIITIRTESNNSFDFTQTSSSMLIFVKPITKIFMSGSATKIQNGVVVEFPEFEIGATKVQTKHTINVEASEVGGAIFNVTFDDTVIEVTPEEIELNPEV